VKAFGLDELMGAESVKVIAEGVLEGGDFLLRK